jgi:hypothetical protein
MQNSSFCTAYCGDLKLILATDTLSQISVLKLILATDTLSQISVSNMVDIHKICY